MTGYLLSLPILVLSLLIADSAMAQSNNVLIADGDESIVADPQTGNLLITYRADDGTLKQVTWVPATKIEPMVKSKIRTEGSDDNQQETFLYSYNLRNGQNAKQTLFLMSLTATNVTEQQPFAPNGWDGSLRPNFGADGVRVTWSLERRTSVNDGLPPGKTLTGFKLESPDLPGVGLARFHGSAPTLAFPDEGPGGKVGEFLEQKRNPDVDSIPLHAAVPMLPVPRPFDALVLLGGIQKHAQSLVNMQLIESVLGGELDRLFTAAIDALRRNDTESALSHLKDLRQLVQRARHEDNDDKKKKYKNRKNDSDGDDEDWDDEEKASSDRPVTSLAARVLLFDVRYVADRLRDEIKDKKRATKAPH